MNFYFKEINYCGEKYYQSTDDYQPKTLVAGFLSNRIDVGVSEVGKDRVACRCRLLDLRATS